MPLHSGAEPGSKGFGENIATEIKAGKPPKQAEAIAYAKARGDATRSERMERIMAALDKLTGRKKRADSISTKLDAACAKMDAASKKNVEIPLPSNAIKLTKDGKLPGQDLAKVNIDIEKLKEISRKANGK